MSAKRIRIISDFNAAPLSGHLQNALQDSDIEVSVCPYGQVLQALGSPSDSWLDIIWTKPELSIASFGDAWQLKPVSHKVILDEVQLFVDSIINACGSRPVFFASWVSPAENHYGMLDWQPDLGLSNLLSKCNLLLAQKFSSTTNIHMLQTSWWIERVLNPHDKKMWYAAKVPYAAEVFAKAAKNIAQSIEGVQGKSRRLIVLDLDDTVWGGVVGEVGWRDLRLGGHDHIGEAFKEFQLALKALTNRGVQLAIASKNDEKVAMDAINNHPEMVLRAKDFAGWRINWGDKASNIAELASEINLGIESILFIDDNPAERARVREALPGLLVPEWPTDPALYTEALSQLGCFELPSLSIEDRQRTQMYTAERDRRATRQSVGSIDAWLARLGTQLTVSSVGEDNITRVAQLFNKTNQLNLTTRRLSSGEILAWSANKNRSMLAVSLEDIFGAMGLIGVISAETCEGQGKVIDFILSCRAMGRGVEAALLYLAHGALQQLGAEKMEVEYVPTDRNRPTLEVLLKSDLRPVAANHFSFDIKEDYAKPEWIAINFDRSS